MKDVEVKKREWVKTAAIVFLSVMLVLTFFSNTIMNRSLPEVAAEYTRASTITARIRGSGTVVANELFEVITKQTYTVNEVRTRLGDEVEAGDVLITLSKASTDELEAKEKELRDKEVELEIKLISDSNSYAVENRAIRDAQNKLKQEQEARDRAQNELYQAQAELNAINFDEAELLKFESDIAEAAARRDRREADRKNAETELQIYEDRNGVIDGDTSHLTPDQVTHYNRLVKNLNDATDSLLSAQRSFDRLNTDRRYAELILLQNRWVPAESKVTEAENKLTAARDAITLAQQNLDSANENLADKKREDGILNTKFDIEVRELEREIEELREEVEELTTGGLITEITATVSGKVTQINISAGRETIPDEPLMIIEVVDMGYTVSIPVTANQSTRVRVGDSAEVDRGWWSGGEPINAVLTSVRSDPENPQLGRLLVFSVSGEGVEGGTQLNITMAQQSENYGIVVPNSAVRSDTNGDFVLVVETRSSPLRNRYIATRVDVTILATDDTNTAISAGGLTGWDFVITTATRPIEPGMQVRLVDNP